MSAATTAAKNEVEKWARELIAARTQIALWREKEAEAKRRLIAMGRARIEVGLCVIKVARRRASWFSPNLARAVLSAKQLAMCCVEREVDVVNVRRAGTIIDQTAIRRLPDKGEEWRAAEGALGEDEGLWPEAEEPTSFGLPDQAEGEDWF